MPLVPARWHGGRQLAWTLVLHSLALAIRRSRRHMEGEPKRAAGGQTMTTFNDREKAFEAKFAHDGEMQFRAEARRNKLLGQWAAGLMGKTADAAAIYAMEVVNSDFEEAGVEDVVRKVAGDLGAKSTPAEVRAKLVELLAVAKTQLMNEF